MGKNVRVYIILSVPYIIVWNIMSNVYDVMYRLGKHTHPTFDPE